MAVAYIFDEVLLDKTLRTAMRGGVEYSTTRISNPRSGFTQSNVNRYDGITKLIIDMALLTPAQLRYINAFFRGGYGSAVGFRAQDFSDNTATAEVFASSTFIQSTDGAKVAFKLYKTYQRPGSTRADIRRIIKPVAGGLYEADGVTARANSITIYKGGVVQAQPAACSVDSTTGIVTFVTAPATSSVLTWTGSFDLPMRFSLDYFEKQYDVASEARSIELIELLFAELNIPY